METRLSEVADGIHQMTTHISEANFSFNQYLIAGDEPALFHTGGRQLFPLVSDAVSRVLPVERCAGSASATSSLTSAAR